MRNWVYNCYVCIITDEEAAYVLGWSWRLAGVAGQQNGVACSASTTGTATLQLTMGSRSCSVSRPEFLQLAPSYYSEHFAVSNI